MMARVRDPIRPAWQLAFNNRVANPVLRLWAPWLPPLALIVHRGRRSGREYRTPVLAWRSGPELFVTLYYGSRAQWVRNVRAGGAEVVRRGRRERFAAARIERDAAAVPRVVRVVGRGLPVLVLEPAGQRS
jgi:deazaflavin-dependent oxidoreductase (nitroreductase family)